MTLSSETQSDFSQLNTERIPKIIHYCWFGGAELPAGLQKCIDSWSISKGYTVMRWDETNCSFDECDFIKKAYLARKYAFISDYYRLKALYEYGGIYLDTDVMMNKSFDDLLGYNAFLNFITDCSVGTAVIGSCKGGKLVKALLDMYDNSILLPLGQMKGRRQIVVDGDKTYIYGFPTNNYFFTFYILKNYPEFLLNNRFQDHKDFVIYPKELFEIGTLSGKHFATHLCAGEWRVKEKKSGLKNIIKIALSHNEVIYNKTQILVRKIRYYRMKKGIPFYNYYLAQKYKTRLPEL